MKFARSHIVLLAPAILTLLALGLYPMLYGLFISFFDFNLARPQAMRFSGLGNYARLLTDEFFLRSLWNTFIFTTGAVVLEFVFGIALALFLNREGRKVGFYILLYSLPVLIAPALSAILWRYTFAPHGGIGPYYLETVFGFSPEAANMLANPNSAMIVLIATDVWQWTPFVALILLYGLTTIPVEPVESARMDGASSWQMFKHVTFPLIRPFILVAVLLRLIDTFKLFDTVFTLTYGGPGTATFTLPFQAWLTAMNYLEVGYASAMAIIVLLVVGVVAQVYIRLIYRGEKI